MLRFPVCKMHANLFPSSSWCASRPLELIHTNVHDVGHLSMSGYRYWITFIDNYLRFHLVIPLKAKSKASRPFRHSRPLLRTRASKRSRFCMMTKEGSTWGMPSSISLPNVAFFASILSRINHSRMKWQSTPIGFYLSRLLWCWMGLAFLKAFGVTALPLWSMSGIGVPLRL